MAEISPHSARQPRKTRLTMVPPSERSTETRTDPTARAARPTPRKTQPTPGGKLTWALIIRLRQSPSGTGRKVTITGGSIATASRCSTRAVKSFSRPPTCQPVGSRLRPWSAETVSTESSGVRRCWRSRLCAAKRWIRSRPWPDLCVLKGQTGRRRSGPYRGFPLPTGRPRKPAPTLGACLLISRRSRHATGPLRTHSMLSSSVTRSRACSRPTARKSPGTSWATSACG